MLESDELFSVMLFAVRGQLIVEFLLVSNVLVSAFVSF
jgi:hypothetical protein